MPLVSVVIPLYQTERFIGAAVSSVLAQTHRDLEILVVDDGSRDSGPDIVRAFGDPRIKIITQANRGLAGARNTGIRHASGDYVALLDADDIWLPDKIETHVRQLEAERAIDISVCASRLIDEAGNDTGLVQSPRVGRFEPEEFFCRNLVGNGSVPVIRRSSLARIAFMDHARGRLSWFDEDFKRTEDIECWLRMRLLGRFSFGYIERALTCYRVNSSGLSADIDAQFATWIQFRDKVATYAPQLVALNGARAEAYQLRYLARRAVQGNSRTLGLSLMLRALRLSPMILVEEPGRTMTSLAAVLAKQFLPVGLFSWLRTGAVRAATAVPGFRP